MSEADAVPLPREGEVFFDVRGEARSMRLSWYADSNIAVFSIWQGNRCTGTFRLPFADLTRMIQTLQAGPHSPVQPPPTQASSYQGHAYSDSGYGQMPDYGQPTYGQPAYEQTRSGGYGPVEGSGGDQAYRSYGSDQAASAERDYGGGDYQEDFGRDRGYGTQPEPSYGGGQAYGSSQQYGSGQPYGAGEPHGEPYSPGHRYDQGQQYNPGPDYAPDPQSGSGPQHNSGPRYDPGQPYGPAQPYRPADPYGPGQPYGSGQPNGPASQYGTASQRGYDPPDYEAPNYGDPRTGPDSDRPTRSDRQHDAESVPDTAMMSFPSVPARNGPSSYR